MKFRPFGRPRRGQAGHCQREDRWRYHHSGYGHGAKSPSQGEVTAVGPGGRDESGRKPIPIDIKVGDRALFGKWSGTEVKLELVRIC